MRMRRSLCLALAVCLLFIGASASLTLGEKRAGEVRVIELEADVALRFTQDGEQIRDIPVVPGEKVLFRIDNTAGFDHNFYIGTDSELQVMGGSTDTGIPDWTSGVRELAWTVPGDIRGLRFGSTVPGHYYTMQGCFSEARIGPDGTVERVAQVEPCTVSGVSDLGREERRGGRVEVPWAGIAVTFPETWRVNVETGPGAWEFGIPVLDAFDLSLTDHGFCMLWAHDGDAFDWDTALAHSDGAIEIGGRPAARFDEVVPFGDMTTYRSSFVFSRPGRVFVLECDDSEARGLRTAIAETIEFLPADE